MTLNGLWYTLVPVETILIYLRVDRNTMCNNLTSASPISISRRGENHSVQANTKSPSSSLMHIRMPILSKVSEKEASMLHLYLLGDNLSHFSTCLTARAALVVNFTSRAFFQLDNSVVVLSQMTWHVSEIIQTLLFLFFQMLHIRVLKIGCHNII
jgi:hypothetical protein